MNRETDMNDVAAFGDEVLAEAEKLRAGGLDANQIAGILCKKDPQGKNYGIGIVLGNNGKPLATSSTLLDYARRELEESGSGVYVNSDALKKDVTEAVLRWQGVPEAHWSHFQLLLPSDAGTGAVQTAIQAATLLKDGFTTLAVETLGWPAYKAIAVSTRLRFQEFSENGIADGAGVLPLYQAGPLNTTGRVPSRALVAERADAARRAGTPVVLDRAYSGFEYARQLPSLGFAGVMRESYKAQIEPFIQAQVPFCLALSPTKAFVTFSLRPCGLLLVYHPDRARLTELAPKLAGLIRARGSSFEHPITRAFVKALVKDRAKLEQEHAAALQRTAEAETAWERMSRGTPIAPLFSQEYAGLFRNPKAAPNAAREIYGAHLYPVFAEGRCRLNVTGIPSDESAAAAQVAHFAKYCL
jgi:hypothetical protein